MYVQQAMQCTVIAMTKSCKERVLVSVEGSITCWLPASDERLIRLVMNAHCIIKLIFKIVDAVGTWSTLHHNIFIAKVRSLPSGFVGELNRGDDIPGFLLGFTSFHGSLQIVGMLTTDCNRRPQQPFLYISLPFLLLIFPFEWY